MQPPVLLDIGVDAYSHQSEVDEVRQRLNIPHHYFDCWIYGFLANKNFNIDEAVSKLQRRETFEREQLANHTVTDWMMENMQKGILQLLGNDKQGRVVFYVVTARDKPTAARRAECRMNFDLFVSYGTRLRADNKSCQMAMLINQENASLWSNVDMTFQTDIALRIAKFYPGCIDKLYFCKMSGALATLAKPIFARLPPIVSDHICIISESERKNGKLLEYFDESVLPVALGGTNDCDHPENHVKFSMAMKEYFEQMKAALLRGLSVKEWELECLFPKHLPETPCARVQQLECSSLLSLDCDRNAGVPRRRRFSQSTNRRASTDTADLITCDTPDENFFYASRTNGDSHETGHFPTGRESMYLVRRDTGSEHTNYFFLLESFFRDAIAETHTREWLSIVQREGQARRLLLEEEQNLVRNSTLLRALPGSLRIIAKGCIWITLMTMTFYFLLAFLAIILFCGCCMIYVFFSMFSKPFFFFPYGCALIVIGSQFALLCSRSIELARRTYDGKLFSVVESFGPRVLAAQFLLCFAVVLSTFIVFCVVAGKNKNIILGLQYAAAIGCMAALCITLLYHILYAFGLAGYVRAPQRGDTTVATLYFFMDVDMDVNPTSKRHISSTAMIISTLAAVTAFAFGVAFLVSHAIFCLTISVVMLFVFLMLVTLPVIFDFSPLTCGLIISAVLYTCLAWTNVLFTVPLRDWNKNWGISACLVLTFAALTDVAVLCYLCLKVKNRVARRWMFRGSWIWLIVQFTACLLLLFVIDYRLGLTILFMSIHLILYGLRVNSGSSMHGVATVLIVFLMLLLFCIMGGDNTYKTVYTRPASDKLLPNYAGAVGTGGHAPATFQTTSDTFLSACGLRFSPTVDAVGMALFAKLVNADTHEVLTKDQQTWFPTYKHVFNDNFSSSFFQVHAFAEETNNHTTEIIALGYRNNMYAVIESMVLWTSLTASSLLSMFTPPAWSPSLMTTFNVMEDISSLLFMSSFNQTLTVLGNYLKSLNDTNRSVYLVGHKLPGVAAAVFGLVSPHNPQSVTFASPVGAFMRLFTGVSPEFLTRGFLSFVPSSSPLALWGAQGSVTTVVPCFLDEGDCGDIEVMAITLNMICHSKFS